IQRIGFLGGEIGGNADDTFTIGTYRTTGFGDIEDIAEPNFSGNINFNVGSNVNGTGLRRVSGVPPHIHEIAVTFVAPGKVTIANGDGGSPNGFSPSEQPYYGRGLYRTGAVFALYQPREGTIRSYTRDGDPLRDHSHMIAFGSPSGRQTIGNEIGSGSLVNSLLLGSNTSTQSFSLSDNLGNVITKTLDIVNDMGVSLNPGSITLSNSAALAFDNSLSVRLQSAERIPLMSPYFRVKYIVKAY
ncbi:MAG: hypothetical protein MUP82_06695, partial [Candidatus Marinimicrobia bacterium]|nr:hypothetical protein [Candidatus Neomarinimicrobiota bacterium]